MKVLIDGVRYVPEPEPQKDKSLRAALELRFDSDAGEDIRARDYLCELLSKVWMEEQMFSGKRPFGNSDWQWELFGPLGRAGFIEGTIRGEVFEMTREQRDAATAYVARMILAMCHGVEG